VKQITKRPNKKAAFTIVELLTVMSIIIILIGLLVPALNMVKQYARRVRQKAQFHSIDVAMELFNNQWDGYPNSDAQDEAGQEYCGALKLCEAMVGQDLMGFHPDSHFRSDCTDGAGNDLYATPTNGFDPAATDPENLKVRKMYLQLENVHAYRLWNIYSNTGPFQQDLFVLCDVYNRVRNVDTGRKIGMPILYYKANTSNTMHDPNGTLPTDTDDKDYIYNYHDNDKLVELGMPWVPPPGAEHPIFTDPKIFYEMTRNKKVQVESGRPNRADSYILISAGPDGEYGTRDDIFNFGD